MGPSYFLKRNYFVIKQSHFKMISGVQILLLIMLLIIFHKKLKIITYTDIYDTPLLEKNKEKL